jgi:hypothetical protein
MGLLRVGVRSRIQSFFVRNWWQRGTESQSRFRRRLWFFDNHQWFICVRIPDYYLTE